MMKTKKTVKRIMALSIAAATTFSLCACNEASSTSSGDVYNKYREDATHVVAVVTGGGIGSKWLNQAAERFAKKQYEHSYAANKKGVYIETKPMQGYSTTGLAGSSDNMFFLGREIETLLADDSVLDITEFVKDETREGGSLESKMLPSARNMCMDSNGKYYALPHLELFGSLNYDRQAFDTANAYFAAEDATGKVEYEAVFANGEISAYMVGSASDKKSAGPDGAFDTEDDGLPSSLEELLVLFDYFAEETEYAPIVFAAEYAYYTNYLLSGLWSSLAGVEKMNNYYNVTGEIDVIKTDASGNFLFTDEDLFPGIDYIKKPQVERITLDKSNAHRITSMVEKYYAMATLEIIERQGWFSKDTYKNTDHYGAQQALIYQGDSPKYSKVAMLIEATYWYNESTNSKCFENYELYTGKVAKERDLRYMCLPTRIKTEDTPLIDETYGNPLLEVNRGIAFLNANLKENDEVRQACLDFLDFLYTDEELAAFTMEMHLPIGMSYSLTNEQLETMSDFGRRLWLLRDNVSGSNIIYNSSNSPIYKANHNQFFIGEGCDTFWTKFDAFEGIDAMSLNGYIAALRQSKARNADGTYKLGTQKLFVSNNAFQNSRFTR